VERSCEKFVNITWNSQVWSVSWVGLSLVALTVLPETTPADCRNAASGFAAAVASMTEALRTYEQCVSASRGRSQCAAAFDELDGAHHDFVDAVA